MGLKELVAASLIAVSTYNTHYQDKPKEKPVVQEEDLEKVLEEADKLYARNNPEKKDAPSDHESAAKLYEKVLRGGFDGDVATKMVDCCMHVSSEKFNAAQRLWEFEMHLPSERKALAEKYNIKNLQQARELAKPLYKSAEVHLEKVAKLQPRRAEVWHFLTIAYVRNDAIDKGLDAAKLYTRLKPEDSSGYHLLLGIYMEKGTPGDILDDIKQIDYVEDDVKIAKMTEGVNKVYDDLRTRKVILQLKIDKIDDRKKAAQLFYLTSKTKWAQEMKKEKIAERDFLNPIQDCYRAGSLDVLAAETDEQREAALKRFEDAFSNINKGLDNGLSTLDKAYFQTLFRVKSVAIDGQEKVFELLRERYNKK